MNKNFSQKIKENITESFGSVIDWFKKVSDDYDFASSPSFVIFMIVVTAGLGVNYFFLSTIMDWRVALAISLMFEVGIFAWKLQRHRIKNSASQAQIVDWATWLSVATAFAMLISSLTHYFHWGYPVAGAALVHIIFYLLFDQNDDIRNNKRQNRMAEERIAQKDVQVDNAIVEAEQDLRIINKITEDISRLRQQYSHLPNDELEFVLETTKNRLLKEYNASQNVRVATAKVADINNDGKIGNRPIGVTGNFPRR